MFFQIISEIRDAETISRGSGIRELPRLRKIHGMGNWQKRKGIASVRFADNQVRMVELHWYEASGVGKREFKIKRYLD